MQNLHPGVRAIPARWLASFQNAIFAFRPGCKIYILAKMQNPHSGQAAKIAIRRSGKFCIQEASVQNLPFEGVQNLHAT